MSFFSEYKNNVKEYRYEEPCDFLFYRPLAYIIVKLTLFLPLTPNHFTSLALSSAIIGGYFLFQGTAQSFIWGGVFILLFGTFDCCDGMVARLKKNGSKYGDLIDMFADSLASLAIYIGFILGSQKMFPDKNILLLTTAAIVVLFVHVSANNYFKKQYHFFLENNPGGRDHELDEYKRDYAELIKNSTYNFDRVLLSIFIPFAKVQKDPDKVEKFDTKNYAKLNYKMLPFWAATAGSTHLTVLAIALVLSNIDIYFYFALLISNLWMLMTLFKQQKVNAKLRVEI